jgi:phage-related protein
MRSIIFYHLPNGQSPIEIFLDSLTGKQAQKITWVLRLIEEMETVPIKYFKKLTDQDDLWEVRIQLGSNDFRMLGFIDHGTLVILTNGFIKKTQKTPVQELELAIRRKREYQRRS